MRSIKQRLEAKLIAAVNRQLQADSYRPSVDGACFTDFIVQGNDEAD